MRVNFLMDLRKGPTFGEYVHKFKILTDPYLLAYRFTGEDLELIVVWIHEN